MVKKKLLEDMKRLIIFLEELDRNNFFRKNRPKVKYKTWVSEIKFLNSRVLKLSEILRLLDERIEELKEEKRTSDKGEYLVDSIRCQIKLEELTRLREIIGSEKLLEKVSSKGEQQ